MVILLLNEQNKSIRFQESPIIDLPTRLGHIFIISLFDIVQVTFKLNAVTALLRRNLLKVIH